MSDVGYLWCVFVGIILLLIGLMRYQYNRKKRLSGSSFDALNPEGIPSEIDK